MRKILSFIIALISISAYSQPNPPQNVTANPSISCPGETVNLSATVTNPNQVKWYAVAMGGTALGSSASGANFVVNPAIASTYYAETATPSGSMSFGYTGNVQSWTVPTGVTAITVDITGGSGVDGTSPAVGGNGGRVQATLTVTAGQVLYFNVGGQGGFSVGGYNGGGLSGTRRGGGASDIRTTNGVASSRIIVAGGGGAASSIANGGVGGNPATAGVNGLPFNGTAIIGGGAATISAGGTAGTGVANGAAGANTGFGGLGGNSAGVTGLCGGNGGGGYFGGGGGGANSASNNKSAGGGGGSSYVAPAYLSGTATYTPNSNDANGAIAITWPAQVSTSRIAVSVSMMTAPTGMTVSNITSSAADLAWIGTAAGNYQWKVVLSGAGSSGAAVATGTTTTLTASAVGLSSATNYQVYIRSACSGGTFSVWSVATAFTTIVACTTPTTFNVTGGGTYCQGGVGLPVDLSGSQSGTRYDLYSDGIATGTFLSGTGSGLNFGNQTIEATYTVVASDVATGACTATMNDSAVVVLSIPDSASVSIAITSGSQSIVYGTSVTFTATAAGGGANPAFQWKLNGVNVGTNADTYTNNALENNDSITCEMAGNSSCSLSPNATSPSITMTVLTNRWYVNSLAASGMNDGTSWANAFVDLQSALAASSAGFTIWVAAGTYHPHAYDVYATFLIPNGVQIFGGFPNTGNPTMIDRDAMANLTTLSGELNSPTDSIDNTRRIVRFDYVDSTTTLDGFTIERGYSAGQSGSAIFNNGGNVPSNPTIKNCIIGSNFCLSAQGGVVYNYGGAGEANPSYIDCTFIGNHTDGDGAAVYNNGDGGIASPTFIRCKFSGNIAMGNYGGAVYNNGHNSGNASPTFMACIFDNNYSGYGGGTVANDGSDAGNSHATFNDCIFSDNTTTHYGGAVCNLSYMNGSANSSMTNCTFYGNVSDSLGGAIANIGSMSATSNPTLKNCILWGNSALMGNANEQQIYNDSITGTISYSYIQDTLPQDMVDAGGNLYGNPQFKDTANIYGIDNLLGTSDDGLMLKTCSEAINGGTNVGVSSFDVLGNVRIFGTNADMGAYELPIAGSSSPTIAISGTANDSTTICQGAPVSLTAVAAGNLSIAEFLWYKNGVAVNYALTNGYTLSTIVGGTNVYTVGVVYANETCLTAPSAPATVIVNPISIAINYTGPTNFCANTPTTLNATPGMANYVWKRSSTIVQNGISAAYNPTGSGNHSVTGTDANGCTKTTPWTVITVRAIPTANAGADKGYCPGFSTQIGSAMNNNYTYFWTPSTGLSNANISNPIASAANSMTYALQVLSFASGCSNRDTVVVTAYPASSTPTLTSTMTPACQGTAISITPTTVGAASVDWYRNGVLLYNRPTTFVQSVTAPSVAGDLYKVKTKTANACISAFSNTLTAWVKEAALPTTTSAPAAVNGVVTVCVPGGTSGNATLTASSTTASPTYAWRVGGVLAGGANSNTYMQMVTTAANNKVVSVDATYPNGCTRTSANKTVKLVTSGCVPRLGSDKDEADEVISLEALSVVAYPNPAENLLNVEFYDSQATQGEIRLYNALGQMVFSQKVAISAEKANIEIRLTSFAAGVYSLVLQTEDSEKVLKVVKR